MSDIADNRKEKLVDTIGRILVSTESARFAVGCGPLVSAVERRLNQLQRRNVKCAATRTGKTVLPLQDVRKSAASSGCPRG